MVSLLKIKINALYNRCYYKTYQLQISRGSLKTLVRTVTKFCQLNLANTKSALKVYLLFLRKILFSFRERRREGEREGDNHQCVVVSCVPPTEDLARNPGMCPDWELNQRPFSVQAHTQSTELHQPGTFMILIPCTFSSILPPPPPHCDSVPVLVVCLVCFCFQFFQSQLLDSFEFVVILMFIVLIFFFLDKSL